MTKEEAKERQAELKSRIESHLDDIKSLNDVMSELEAIINKKDDWRDKLVQPETSDYYRIHSDTRVGLEVFYTYTNKSKRKPEHVFRTQEQAEIVKDKMLLMQEMHSFAHVKNEGWLPDWRDADECKWGIALGGERGMYVDWYFFTNGFVFGIAVKSEEIAEEMLEEFGERIDKIYNKQY